MEENNVMVKTKNSKGLIVLVVILLITVIGLGSYIVYDKVNNENSNKNITEVKKEDNNIKEENDGPNEGKYDVQTFNQTSTSYKLQDGNELLFLQAKGNDMNSGLQIDYKDVGHMIDVEEYYNLESVGIIENTDNIIAIELMSNEKNEKKVFYEILSKAKLMDVNISADDRSSYIVESGTKLNTNYVIDKIGKVQINNVNYPVVVSGNDNYIINEDGSLSSIDKVIKN